MRVTEVIRKEAKFERILTIIVFILILFFLLYVVNETNVIDSNIEKNKFITVGRVYKYEEGMKGKKIYLYEYYYKGQIFDKTSNEGNIENGRCLERFFIVNLSTKNPEYSKIFLNQEVKDTAEILKAGFSIKDLSPAAASVPLLRINKIK